MRSLQGLLQSGSIVGRIVSASSMEIALRPPFSSSVPPQQRLSTISRVCSPMCQRALHGASKGAERFRRPAIAEDALTTLWGRRLYDQFIHRGIEPTVFDVNTNARDLPSERATPDLYVLRVPRHGWLKAADHGQLFVRAGEVYVSPVVGCRASCAYCYLRGKALLRPLTFYVDVDDMWRAMVRHVAQAPRSVFVTGEYADSLADEDVFGANSELITRIPELGECASLEIRTKSASVAPITDLRHAGRTIVAFSLAPPRQEALEPGTASVSDRLRAASACQRAGYHVALKFEPIILTPQWRSDLGALLETVAREVSVETLDHVSVGVLRWSPMLGTLPAFRYALGQSGASTEEVPYKGQRPNFTLKASDREALYEEFTSLLVRYGVDVPRYVSLETADMVRRFSSPCFGGQGA